jgi:hypothetical protein
VNGKAPQNSDHFIAIRQLIELKIERNKVAERWNRVMPPLGVSSLFEVNIPPEEYAFQYVAQIQTSLNWHESNWLKLEAALISQGLNWIALLGEAPPATTAHHLAERLRHTVEKKLSPVVDAEIRRRRLALLNSQFANIEKALQDCIDQRKTESQVAEALMNGVKSRSKLIYSQAIERLRSLHVLKPIYKDRCNFLNRLKPSAPVWVEMITNRQDLGVIEINSIEPSKAWSWLKLNQELNSRSSLSLEVIQEKIKQTCLKKYGVENCMQNEEIMEKMTINSYRTKIYTFPSGNQIIYQGYENYALDELLREGVLEEEIINDCKNVPEIWYEDVEGKSHRYYVDIFIPSRNLCIEVKSNWTIEQKKDNIFLKQQSLKDAGYHCEIWVYNGKGEKIECYE